MIKDLKPGVALDVGMGQSRNTICLAEHGWDVIQDLILLIKQ